MEIAAIGYGGLVLILRLMVMKLLGRAPTQAPAGISSAVPICI
jgi:hypothetical protein